METPLVHGYDGMKKKNLHFQIQEENETQHENLSDLANKSNYLTIKSTELELDKKRRDSEHHNKKSVSTFNEENDINQSQIKETLIKLSNQSQGHHSDKDTAAA